ncbi:MAG: PD-(D/E)XK nuclease family protein, partial [Solirubrobacterales bacterium]|nr:PD-(D/E)XK nuclease family protein [Solirubrobacterales bacterium]
AISSRAGTPLAPRAAGGGEEQLAFALACEAARERLVVSYARRGTGDSRPRLPSIFFRELASQLTGERVSAERAPLLAREDVERIPGNAIAAPIPGGRLARDTAVVNAAAADAISESERDRTFLQARVTAPIAIATFRRAAPAFDRALRAGAARRGGHYSEWDGALGGAALEAIAALIPATRVFSPTALESYATCPQSFLMGDVLRIRAVEEPERTVRIDALRRGNLLHRIFQRFQEECEGAGPAALATDAESRMRAIAEQECEAAQGRGETGYPAMWEADRLEVIEDCLRWLEIEREDPDTRELPLGACEARFGRRRPGERDGALSRDAPLEIPTGDRVLSLAGRIDRIAWDAEPPRRFRVIDYKSGRVRDEKPGQLQGGRMLQLPLYVMAAAQLLGIDASAGEAAYAYATRRGGFRTVAWESGELAQRHDELVELLGAMLKAMDRGDFMVAPWKADTACRYCDFDPICPTARGAYLERRQGDERLERWAQEIRSAT